MKRIWLFIGKAGYWLGWPALFLYLYFTKRTRVLIVHDGKILLTKSWLGSGDWHLPGGGLHRKEEPTVGAIRELREELGLELAADKLVYLHEKLATGERHFRFFYTGFMVTLDEKPVFIRPKGEVVALEWFDIQTVKQRKLGGKTVQDMLADREKLA